jgi:hypothetical protein
MLSDLVAVNTVSAVKGSSEVLKGAQLVSSMLSEVGFSTEVKSCGGHPMVVGELGDGPISILIYNHYDVQPPDPLELWDSPPFELVERDGKLFGRGVSDNKGDIVARLAAIEALTPYLEVNSSAIDLGAMYTRMSWIGGMASCSGRTPLAIKPPLLTFTIFALEPLTESVASLTRGIATSNL